jgi:hypothetical protein
MVGPRCLTGEKGAPPVSGRRGRKRKVAFYNSSHVSCQPTDEISSRNGDRRCSPATILLRNHLILAGTRPYRAGQ